MIAQCPECEEPLEGEEWFCPACNAPLAKGGDGAGGPRAVATTHTDPGGRRLAYIATVAAGLTFVGSLGAAAELLGTTAGGVPDLAFVAVGVALVAWLASIVSMYLDLRSLRRRPWDAGPGLWVIGAVLGYILVVPIYVYERRDAIL